MKNINFINTKIGIWGFGIVGQSVFKYLQPFTNKIQIMDKKSDATIPIIPETAENIVQFLQHNDIIIPSPGIVLHDYQNYAHKFVQELDIFAKEFQGSTMAITGTVGKTTVTSLLAQATPEAIAAGNIGYAMLHLLNSQTKHQKIVLELSSYQLQYAQNFAPDIAIWTNFYPNHLDHHSNEQEYFDAKCNIIRHQRKDQIALLPYNLIEKIEKTVQPQAQIYLFNEDMDPRLREDEETSEQCNNIKKKYPVFFINNNQLLLQENNQIKLILNNFDQLADITFQQNWLVIVAALYLQNIDVQNFATYTKTLKPEPHRCEFVKILNNVAVYNDSKSTVWQAAKHAVDKFSGKKIALFLGGISKGTDRTPLIEYLQNKSIVLFAFGKEAELLANLCQKFKIAHQSASTLQESLDQYLSQQANFEILLFSPAGASFDLFKNFEDRGEQFKKMIHAL
ncbi:UDP-N-acetylmuramoyl-L-alanine--D-glutamate ligase [Candidatus Babeliales bacterium]|nr:UDP-N-acetylmuramoyl-L-alanine--D-glutamate ligase [Candidatus Babeliales bacterium]